MSSSTIGAGATPSAKDSPNGDRTAAQRRGADLLVYGVIAALVWGAWQLSRLGLFSAGDRVGYWLGVGGGVSMLLLFTYPLRKYVRVFHRWGKVKWWFLVHMVLGIGGPVLILVHSTFHIGSLNAAVALYSMLIVAGSGVIGRFLYLRVHRGLSGEKTSLRQLQMRAGLDQTEARSRLHFAPAVERRLLTFEERAAQVKPGLLGSLRQVIVLPLQQRLAYRDCVAGLRAPLREIARARGWSNAEVAKRDRLARKLVRRYLQGVTRVAQYHAYERLFALWHVAHVPFVYLMVLSAVAHVVAVHAY